MEEEIRIRQADNAKQVADRIAELVAQGSVVRAVNDGEYAQKTVAVVELAKRKLAEGKKTVYQYNRLESAKDVFTPADPLGQRKLKYRVPRLTVLLSLAAQDVGPGWTTQ